MEPDAVPGLRQRKKDQLRTQLIDEALRLFIERGYDATTIEDIVADLNVSPRTFFRYFESKVDVVVAGPFQIGSRLADFARAAPPGSGPLDIARHAVRELAAYRQSLPDALRHATLIVETPELATRLARERDYWARGLALLLEPQLEADDVALHAFMIASSAIGALGAAFEQWVRERGARPFPEILERAFALIDAAHDKQRPSAA
jgi:AcrR family transcriptional regulator